MKFFRLVLLLFSLIIICQSCSDDREINQIVTKYDSDEFKVFRGRYMFFREYKNFFFSSVYIVSRIDCFPYGVEVNNLTNQVTIFNIPTFDTGCGGNYFSESEINEIILAYLEYGFFYIKIDEFGNVHITPNSRSKVHLLRKAINSPPTVIDGYAKYRGNWYIKRYK